MGKSTPTYPELSATQTTEVPKASEPKGFDLNEVTYTQVKISQTQVFVHR